MSSTNQLPILMTADEAATLFRTTRTAIYAMVARGQLPGVVRLGRRMLFRTSDLISAVGETAMSDRTQEVFWQRSR
jgi:excisionase family DNA binding protein